MSIDKDKIKHISKLARISVEEKKIDGLAKDLSSIFKFIEQLNELNTDNVEPLSSILNTHLGCPAAAKSVLNHFKELSIKISTLFKWPTGETPPIVYPV